MERIPFYTIRKEWLQTKLTRSKGNSDAEIFDGKTVTSMEAVEVGGTERESKIDHSTLV